MGIQFVISIPSGRFWGQIQADDEIENVCPPATHNAQPQTSRKSLDWLRAKLSFKFMAIVVVVVVVVVCLACSARLSLVYKLPLMLTHHKS